MSIVVSVRAIKFVGRNPVTRDTPGQSADRYSCEGYR